MGDPSGHGGLSSWTLRRLGTLANTLGLSSLFQFSDQAPGWDDEVLVISLAFRTLQQEEMWLD